MFILHVLTFFGVSLVWIYSTESAISLPDNVTVLYMWKNVEFLYPSDADRDRAIEDGSYVVENTILNDVDVWKGQNSSHNRIFVTTPRFVPGIPFTVSTITSIQSGDSNLLAPFPNIQSQNITAGCGSIISVDKIHIDKCGRLWIIDTGILYQFTNATRICRPKILIYDLENDDKLIEYYEFPDGVVNPISSLTTTVTDSRTDNCQDTIAYIADLHGQALVVFDLANKISWRITHNFFYAWPNRGTLTISGVTFDLMDAVFALALGPVSEIDGDRLLYFHSLASIRESWIPTSSLRNRELIKDYNKFRTMFSLSEEFREGQSSLEVITDDGIMIYNDLLSNSLVCWNTKLSAVKENTHVIYQDNEHLQFISGMKLKGDKLWLASNQAQNIISQTKTSGFRYRVMLIESVSLLLKKYGSKCLTQKLVHEQNQIEKVSIKTEIKTNISQTFTLTAKEDEDLHNKNHTHGWRIDPLPDKDYKNDNAYGKGHQKINVTHGWKIDPYIISPKGRRQPSY